MTYRIESVSTRGFNLRTATADSVTMAYNTVLTFDPRSVSVRSGYRRRGYRFQLLATCAEL